MRVVSVNVSLPKTVEWRGRKVTTAIFKEPVEGRVRIRTRPSTGSLKIAVVTLRPLHSTVFGRETFTETTRMASGVRDSAP